MEHLNWVSNADPRLTNTSARVFSTRGAYWMVKVGNSFKSPWTLSSSFAKRSPVSSAWYSASLFEAGKPSVIACSNKVPSGVIMTTLAPTPFWFDASSTRNCHMSLGWLGSEKVLSAFELSFFLLTSFSSSADGVNSATKSANA
ncbi:hypothetical protein L3X38_025290 [Prunus dulcis]|uniref:Uncharacterized protein n=1 Tax=Prunus dulcis TaxID=3755 RepID=A0AAD4W3A5_PRUDU|nr:hypothetical protein L3X38_025290 [Prunus dulcis]